MYTAENLYGVLDARISNAQERIDKFREWLEHGCDPLYAFEWSDEAFAAAAEVCVLRRVREGVAGYVNGTQTLKNIEDYAAEEVLRGAKYPCKSTSQPSNLCALYKVQAWAEALEMIRGWVKREHQEVL